MRGSAFSSSGPNEERDMGPFGRAWRLIRNPRAEWRAIETDGTSTSRIVAAYVVPLAILPALAYMAGLLIFELSTDQGNTYRPAFSNVLALSASGIVLWIASIYVLAQVVDALAPRFGARRDFRHAFKLAAHVPTAIWIGLLAYIVPDYGWIGLTVGALYSVYLLLVGVPVLMMPPEDKAVIYALACFLAATVIALLVALVIRVLFTIL